MTKQLTFDEFVDTYKPIDNTFDTTRGHDGKLFETYGLELSQVNKVSHREPDKIWTLLTDDDDELVIVPGYHHINRQGYFICERPFYSYEIEVSP